MEIPVKYLIVALALAARPSATYAQEKDQPKKTVERVPITATVTMDGHEMFTHYCAVCHGADAKGTGPAADALKKTPAELMVALLTAKMKDLWDAIFDACVQAVGMFETTQDISPKAI